MSELKGTEEQLTYADLLDKGMKIGLLMLMVTFFIYLTGIFKPYIPVSELPNYWGLSVHDYLEHADVQAGWAWLGLLGKGDFLNFTGIAFLAGITIICYMRIVPILFEKKDRVFAV
ncbi:MAG: hypothetical protein R3231_07135, partial [bacterium]|nr:hypothetical protein [bacterium]